MSGKNHFKIHPAIVVFLISINTIISQPYQVGHVTISFTDTSRNNRDIPVEVYYPALISGEEVPVAPGQFPVLSFGHGFVMNVGSYVNFSDVLVPEGYILAFSDTETGISPSHQDLALDMAFILHAFREEGNDPASIFYGSVAFQNAVMGHSMGGGSSMLAAAGDTIVKAVANFAAANTNPSAIIAATAISVPTLLFSGSGDCVTPPEEHQLPMYDSLASACKTLVNITGGGHCYFANENFLCTFGENSCGPEITITREQQQNATFDILLPWLDYFLKGDEETWEVFLDSLFSSDRITFQYDCKITGIQNRDEGQKINLRIYPVPFGEHLCIEGDRAIKQLYINDLSGRQILKEEGNFQLPFRINTQGFSTGIYQIVIVSSTGERMNLKGIKL